MTEVPSKDMLNKVLTYTLSLEYLGIHVVDSGETNSFEGSVMYFKLEIPERSDLEIFDTSVKELVGDRPYHTEDDLIELAKYIIRDKISRASFEESEVSFLFDDIGSEEWDTFVKDTVKIYVKVLKGEVWNNKKASEAIKGMLSKFKEVSEYKEV